ncbi:MAG: hypothetical protein ACERK9_14250, partial [Deltaproteobacteria bacterium]
NGNQGITLFLDLCYQAVHPLQSFFDPCHSFPSKNERWSMVLFVFGFKRHFIRYGGSLSPQIGGLCF